jgi:glycosyltransferase involved in cell wall biosynthesis
MRILFWSESFWPSIGGSEVFAEALIDGLRARGHEFEVVTAVPADAATIALTDTWKDVPLHRIAIDERAATEVDLGVIVPARHRVARIKQRFRPDLVHVSLPGPSTLVHRFTRDSAWTCPTLVSLHVPLEPTLVAFHRAAYETIRDAQWVTACSRALNDHARWMIPEIRGRSSVVHNGLPLPAGEVLSRASTGRRPFTLVCAGRLVEQKGFATAVRALGMLVSDGTDARLQVLGDGPDRQMLTELAESLGLAARVEFAGWRTQEQVVAAIAAADAVLIPSEWEPFGLVALQAAQCARPAIASRVDGLPEVIEDGVTGLLAEAGDAAAFATHARRLEQDPAFARALGEAARERARERFGVTRMLDAYERLYEQLTRRGDAPAPGAR